MLKRGKINKDNTKQEDRGPGQRPGKGSVDSASEAPRLLCFYSTSEAHLE